MKLLRYIKLILVFNLSCIGVCVSVGAQEASGYNWKNWSDELIFTQGQDFRTFAKEGKTHAGGEPTARGAYERFIYLCEKHNAQGCVYAVDTARELMKDKAREIDAYLIACENGETKFCGAGYMSTKDKGKTGFDRVKAEQFAKKGCSLGDDFLCKGEAWLVSLKSPKTVSPAKKLADGVDACDNKGRRDYCSWVGSIYAGLNADYESFKNISLAQKYLNKACGDGDVTACLNAININDPDQGNPANPDATRTAFATVCQFSETNKCRLGLSAYAHGAAGVKKDNNEVAFFAGISCDRFQQDCYHAAYFRTLADPSNITDITHFAGKACQLGDADGCTLKGNTLLHGDQFERAMGAYRKACSLGDKEICTFVDNKNAAIARRARLDAEYKRCRGGCPAGTSFTTSKAPKSNWEPSYCASHRKAWRRARDAGQSFAKNGACGIYR